MNNNIKSNEEALKEWKEKEKLLDIQRNKKRLYEEEVKSQLEAQVKIEPNNINLLLRLALFELEPPEGHPDKCIEYLNQVLNLDENNVIALLLFAHLHEYVVFFIPDELLAKIETLHSNNAEYNAMLKYVASWAYAKFRKNEPLIEEKLLKESIEAWPHHVWNYFRLAELYTEQGRIDESRQFAQQALKNIQKVYSYYAIEADLTSINEFLDSEIKGIHVTMPQLENIKKLLK